MKKLLLLLVMLSSVAQADAGDAFATAFANSLNRSMGGTPENTQTVEVTVKRTYWVPVTDYGARAVAKHQTKTSCDDAVSLSGGYYAACVLVNE